MSINVHCNRHYYDIMFSTLLGNLPTDIRPDIGFAFLRIVAINMYDMYKTVLMNREGVG